MKLIVSLALLAMVNAPAHADDPHRKDEVSDNCTFNGIELSGQVKVVESFPDLEIEIVESFPDLNVKRVDSFADDCGEWEFVESFPDFTVKFVDSFPDLKVEFVESFPGIP